MTAHSDCHRKLDNSLDVGPNRPVMEHSDRELPSWPSHLVSATPHGVASAGSGGSAISTGIKLYLMRIITRASK